MAATAQAVDTATGQIEQPPGQTYLTTTRQDGTRIMTFKNNFEHYISNANGNPAVTTVTNLCPGNYAGLENHEGLYVVPYHNRGIAFVMQQFYRLVGNYDRIKIHKMGFHIKKCTVLQENLTTRASTTILENTFQSRLSCFMYIDNHHKFDNLVGEPGLTSYLTPAAFNPALSDPQSVYPSFAAVCPTRVTSGPTMFHNAATLPCWATSQQDGALINCSMYYQNLADNIPWTMHDMIPGFEFGEPIGGKTAMPFIWTNKKPEWERIQGYGFKIDKNEDFSRLTDTSNGNPLWASRERALSMVYRGTINPESTDDAVEIGASREFSERASDELGSNTLLNESYSPPYVYLKVEPIQGPTGPMTFIVRLMIEYMIQVEVMQDNATPAWIQNTPFSGLLDNTTTIVHGGFFANPREHVGLGAQTEWDNSAMARRSKKERKPRPLSPGAKVRHAMKSTKAPRKRENPLADNTNKRRRPDDFEESDTEGPPSLDYMGNDLPNKIVCSWPVYSTAHSRAAQSKKNSKSTAYQAKEFYGVVIGGDCLQPGALIPQTYKRDNNGDPIESKYGNGYWLIDMAPGEGGTDDEPTADRYICRNWRTPREVLDCMGKKERPFIGAVKKWLHANKVAVWFHAGGSDLCSQFGGNHLHVLYQSTKASNGAYIDPHNTAQYKACKEAIKPKRKTLKRKRRGAREESDDEEDSDGPDPTTNQRFYFKYEGLKSVEKFIQYCHQAPRLFLGASGKKLLQIRREVIKNSPLDALTFLNTDIFEHDEYFDDSDQECQSKRTSRRRCGDIDSDDDDDTGFGEGRGSGPGSAKRARIQDVDPETGERVDRDRRSTSTAIVDERADEDRDEYPRRDTRSVEPEPDRRNAIVNDFDIKQTGIKYETKSVRLQTMIIKIMHHLYAYDKESISFQIGRLDQKRPENKRLYQCWNRLLAEGVNPYCLKSRDQLKPIFQHEKFVDICTRFVSSHRWKDKQYLSIDDSIDLLSQWCEHNEISWGTLISTVLNVMDKKSVKRNTILVMGPSNGGKSVVISVPLQTLIPVKCLLSSAGNSSQFLWQDVPGTRCVFMEEADITPEHHNTAKKILGGEECAVDVKQQHASTVFRVPVIMTCNSDPFYMIPKACDRLALRNRVFAFSSKPWDELQHVEEQVNPGMWYKIVKACDSDDRLITEEEVPSPEEIKTIELPRQDQFVLSYEEA